MCMDQYSNTYDVNVENEYPEIPAIEWREQKGTGFWAIFLDSTGWLFRIHCPCSGWFIRSSPQWHVWDRDVCQEAGFVSSSARLQKGLPELRVTNWMSYDEPQFIWVVNHLLELLRRDANLVICGTERSWTIIIFDANFACKTQESPTRRPEFSTLRTESMFKRCTPGLKALQSLWTSDGKGPKGPQGVLLWAVGAVGVWSMIPIISNHQVEQYSDDE